MQQSVYSDLQYNTMPLIQNIQSHMESENKWSFCIFLIPDSLEDVYREAGGGQVKVVELTCDELGLGRHRWERERDLLTVKCSTEDNYNENIRL